MTINCMLGTKFPELKAVQTDMVEFIKQHDDNAPHHIKSRPHGYWDATRKWEYAMAIAFTNPKTGDKALDVGGASSVLPWYLASKGVIVTSIDTQQWAVDRGNKNKEYFKYPNIEFIRADAKDVGEDNEFDLIYSICVFEHLMQTMREKREGRIGNFWKGYRPTEEEWEYERSVMRRHGKCLKPGGMLVVSYDYKPVKGKKSNGRASYLRSTADVVERIVAPTGCGIIGGDIRTDPIPGSHSIGIVFLRKPT